MLGEAAGDGCTLPSRLHIRLLVAQETDSRSTTPRFIIDGIITLPIAFYGFLIFPDLPATTSAFYLTEEASIRAARRRDYGNTVLIYSL
jgi:hypothetical protein